MLRTAAWDQILYTGKNVLTSEQFAGLGAAALAAACGVTAYAVLAPGSQIFGHTLVAPPRPQHFALTFDDGPNPAATQQLLDVLARRGVRATFFLIGKWVRREPVLTRAIAAAGHAIGNHTEHHLWLPRLSAAEVHAELSACNDALEQTLGQRVTLFRPPHGARSPAVLRSAHALGLSTVQWNIIAGDWNPHPPAELLHRIERRYTRNRHRGLGSMLVLHDGGQKALGEPRMPTVEAVDRLLHWLPSDTEYVVAGEW
jgi:peptidoglycan/xylan/chitin deacetylase (PgdA/CDA1 family)